MSMETNVIIETVNGVVRTIYADGPTNVVFAERDGIDTEAPNFNACILGSAAMIDAVYEATVVDDDVHAIWLAICDTEIPSDMVVDKEEDD